MVIIICDLNRRTSLLLTILVMLTGTIRADITLSGEQDGFYEKAEYLVTEDVVIKAGKTLTFAAGSIIRFKQYTGIIVNGSLECNGTPIEPIIFTSSKTRNFDSDDQQFPQPFDWNGIHVKSPQTHVILKNVDISYSTYGLKFEHKESTADIEQLTYGENGTISVELGDSIIDIYDGEALSMTHPDVAMAKSNTEKPTLSDSAYVASLTPPDTSSAAPISIDNSSSAKDKPVGKTWTFPTRIALGAIAALSAGAGAYSYMQLEHYHEKYSSVNSRDEDIVSYREKGQLFETGVTASAIAFGVAATGFCVTFVF